MIRFPTFDLTDKVAIVTGGARGLGRTITLGLAHFGAHVVVADVLTEEAASVKAEIVAMGRRCLALTVDVTNADAVRGMVESCVTEFGAVDVLVNNAGVNVRKSIVDVTEADWDKVLDTNLKGAFLCTQAVGQVMAEKKRGSVINIASIFGFVGWDPPAGFTETMYCASKGGIVQLTRAFAVEWAKHNVRVNAIAPAFLRTPLIERLWADDATREDILRRTPLARLGEPDEIIGPVIFLASDAASFVTGQTLVVDGGWLAV